jgi:hypothetical protein
MRVFVAGGSGQIGRRLIQRLTERGEHVVLLTRDLARAQEKFHAVVGKSLATMSFVVGDPTEPGPWMQDVSGCQAVVNLVGEGIFNRRWSETFKLLLRDSRVQSTANLVQAIREATVRPEVLVQGSAIGYYGMPGDAELTEASPAGDDFLAQLCVEWEAVAETVGHGVRLAIVRTGVVLDTIGGALKKMLTPFKMYVGGKVGSGKQWVSWIHHEDEVGILLLCLEHRAARGPINATAPLPVRNSELAKAIGEALGKPSGFPTPGFMLKLAMGQVAQIVLGSQKVLPQRAQELGYEFKFPDIQSALRDILKASPP